MHGWSSLPVTDWLKGEAQIPAFFRPKYFISLLLNHVDILFLKAFFFLQFLDMMGSVSHSDFSLCAAR